MRLYAGLDVSLEKTAICVIDQDGKIVQEIVAPTDAEAIADVLGAPPHQPRACWP